MGMQDGAHCTGLVSSWGFCFVRYQQKSEVGKDFVSHRDQKTGLMSLYLATVFQSYAPGQSGFDKAVLPASVSTLSAVIYNMHFMYCMLYIYAHAAHCFKCALCMPADNEQAPRT